MLTEGIGEGELSVPLEVLARRLGRAPDEVLRLDGDANPYGCSLRVLETLGSANSLYRPGDPEARDLRVALEGYALCARDRITVGAAPAEILERLLRVLTQPGQTIAVPTPTRPLYAAVAARLGVRVVQVPLTRGFELDTAALLDLLARQPIALVVVPAPNDPTGTSLAATEVVRLLRSDLPILVDESLYEFSGPHRRPARHRVRQPDRAARFHRLGRPRRPTAQLYPE